MTNFSDGLRYPFGKPGRLWNILWVFVPIFGWFALYGYGVRIVQALFKGKTKNLPAMDDVVGKFKLGFWMFVKVIPFAIAVGIISGLLDMIPFFGILASLVLQICVYPYLTIHFMVSEKFIALFEFEKAIKVVFGNFKEYLIAFVFTILVNIIFLLMSIVLIGIPCMAFGSRFFLVDFYRKAKAKKSR